MRRYVLMLFPRSNDPAFSGGHFETLAEALTVALDFPDCAYEVRAHSDGDRIVSAAR